MAFGLSMPWLDRRRDPDNVRLRTRLSGAACLPRSLCIASLWNAADRTGPTQGRLCWVRSGRVDKLVVQIWTAITKAASIGE